MVNKKSILLLILLFISGCSASNYGNSSDDNILNKIVFYGETENWSGKVEVEQFKQGENIKREEIFELNYKGNNKQQIEYVQFYIDTLEEGYSKLGYNSPFNSDGVIKGSRSCGGCREVKSSEKYYAILAWKGHKGLEGEIFTLNKQD